MGFKCFRILMGLCLCWPGVSRAVVFPEYDVLKSSIQGQVHHLYAGDYNGDAAQDLCLSLTLEKGGKTRRQLLFYFQPVDLQAPDVFFEIPDQAMALNFKDLYHEGIERPVFLMENGVFMLFIEESSPRLQQIIHASHSLYAPHPEILYALPFILSHAQGHRVIWATSSYNYLYQCRKDTSFLMGALPRNFDYHLTQQQMVYPIPRLIQDRVLQGENDVWDMGDSGLLIHHGRNETGQITSWRPMLALQSHTVKPLNPARMRLTVTDLDANGLQDVVAVHAVQGGLAAHVSHVQIYKQQPDGLPEQPDQVLLTENLHGEHKLTDLNRDGLPDLLLFRLEISLKQAFRFLLTGKIAVGFDVFMNRPVGGFSQNPDQRLSWRVPAVLDQMILSPYQDFHVADMNGDGYPDLFVRVNDHYLMIPGLASGQFDMQNRRAIGSGQTSQICLADWNGDGLADILMLHRCQEENMDHILMYSSQ